MARNAAAFMVEREEDERKPGACKFVCVGDKPVGVQHACPCGCGGLTFLAFRGTRAPGDTKKDEWDVTGQWPDVTLSPSIGVRYDGSGRNVHAETGQYHWHGYLKKGVFEEG